MKALELQRPCSQISETALYPKRSGSNSAGGFEAVVLGLAGGAVTPSRGRAVAARARSKGSLLIVTEGQWDGPDLRISSRVSGYSGLSAGRGRVIGIQLDVAVAGKGFQQRTASLEIRDDTAQLRWATVDDNTLTLTPPLRAAQ